MFDDGYKDNIEHAAPILEKYNCKASFYVVTDCIDQNKPTWTYILEYIFQYTSIADVKIAFGFLPNELIVDQLVNKEARMKYVSKLKPFLKKISHEDRNVILNYLINSYHDVTVPKLMMDWNDLKMLKRAGHYIGSHTATHCMLETMTDENEIRKELMDSALAIQKHLGYFPLTISYPIGSFNENVKRLSKEAGYKIGLAVKQNWYDPDKDDLFEIPRIELYNEAWWKTKWRITHTLEILKKIINYK